MRTILQHLNGTQDLGYWKSKKLLDWRISLSLDEKSQTGYVGLKNLGCTCYMNSLIQQLFMIPQLRESILASPDNHVGKIEESCLFQLKNIFASLKAYDGQFYNAKDFCLNFDGTSLDIREQMDVDEFYNTLIDKIENHIKDSEYQNIFKHFFGFTISDEFICKGCPHTKEKDVYFNSIQLQVLNKKSIVESLKSYVEGELLEGDNAYYCETCDKKVNALKRQCIKKLPRMLIVVLKRFDFDYENMVKIKVNDYCEFPFELNMEPFTQEYLRKSEKKSEGGIAMNEETTTETSENEEKETYSKNKPANFYKYNLSGVIIHTGTSESGHYYSIIKDYEKEQWNEFNDTIVKSYDINDLPNEAYGGTENVFNRDNKKEVLEKQTNAYLLFYKRQYEEDEIDQDVEMKPEESLNTYKEKKYKVVKTWDKFSNITPTILDSIHTDNFQYWINKILFSKEYHSFVTDLLVNSNTYDHITKNYLTKNDNFEIEPNLYLRPSYEKTCSNMNYLQKSIKNNNVDSKMLVNNLNKNDYIFVLDKDHEMYLFKFACSFFFNVLIRAKEKYYLPAMMDVLKAFINKDDQLADWLLEEFSNYDLINEYLIESPVIDVKKLIIGLLYAAMIKSYKSKRGVNLQSNTLLIQFINNILNSIIKNSNNNDKDLSILQYILYRFTLLGDETKIYLINVGVLNYLTYYYIGKNDKYAKEILLTNKDFIKANYTVPNHMELNKKLMNKVDRLSAFEELIEKKHSEKLISNRLEDYLLMTFCEIINICNINKKQTNPVYDLSKEKNAFKYLDFTNNVLINILLLEIKSKSSTVAFSKMMCNLCFNNIDHTNSFLQILIECIKQMDSYELDFTMIIFKNFLFNINDSNKDSRVNIY
jgi:ubiquitin C-terminal hydrolase